MAFHNMNTKRKKIVVTGVGSGPHTDGSARMDSANAQPLIWATHSDMVMPS